MSDDKKRFKREYVLPVALDLARQLRPRCARLEIAGSLRRGAAEVADIEIVYVPKPVDGPGILMMYDNHVDPYLDEMLHYHRLAKRPSKAGVFTWGAQNKLGVLMPSGIPVDLFATTEANWWTTLVVRTGGKASNVELASSCKAVGKRLMAYGPGVLDLATGEVATPASEEDVFRLCGVPYRRPEDRP